MNIDAGTALAIVGAIIGALGAVNSWRTARTSAKKDEVDALRDELRSRLAEIEIRHKDLCEWVLQLGYDPIARKKITQPLGGGS